MEPQAAAETHLFDNPYDREVQEDIWRHERKKTSIALLLVGINILLMNVIAYGSAGALEMFYFLDIALVPLLFIGLCFFARLQPMLAAIGGIVVIIGMTVWGVMMAGAVWLVAGWLFKSIALYYIISAVRHAREAEAARKKLTAIA